MSQRPWFPLYVGEYLADTMHLNLEQHGAYLKLLMHAWNHGGIIPAENKERSLILGIHHHRGRLLWGVIGGYWILYPEGYRNKRLDKELAQVAEISEKRRKAAEARHHANAPTNVDTPTPTTKEEEERSCPKPPKTNGTDPPFEAFWSVYPRREAKANAAKSWNRLSKADREAALAALPDFPFQEDKKFIPMGSTWINGRRWEDELTDGPAYEPSTMDAD